MTDLRSSTATNEPVPLADHNEIGRKVLGLPWAIQSAVVTIAAHCTVIKDKCPPSDVSDLVGCISQDLLELANALSGGVAQAGTDRGALTQVAAECHRAKWQFDFSDEIKIGMGVARRSLTKAFEELHRIGDMAMKLRDAAPQPLDPAYYSPERGISDAMIQAGAKAHNPMAFEIDEHGNFTTPPATRREARQEARTILIAALAMPSTHQSAPAQSAAHNSGSPGSDASGDAGADTFDPSEWERIVEDRQEAVALPSTNGNTP